MKKVLFIDRDGTIIKETVDEQIDAFDKMTFYPKAFTFLGKIAKELDYELVMITNQDGLGTDSFPEDTFWPVHNFIMNSFENEGVIFDKVFLDRTFPHENANTRKPGTGLLTEYFSGDYDLANSFVIGDRLTDMELAKNLGAKGIFINDETNLGTGEITVKREELDAYIDMGTNDWAKWLGKTPKIRCRIGETKPAISNAKRMNTQTEMQLGNSCRTAIPTVSNDLPTAQGRTGCHHNVREMCIEELPPFMASDHILAIAIWLVTRLQNRPVSDSLKRCPHRQLIIDPIVASLLDTINGEAAEEIRIIPK